MVPAPRIVMFVILLSVLSNDVFEVVVVVMMVGFEVVLSPWGY